MKIACLKSITVHGARQHNLKNIDVEIPRNTFTVITGLSGSGKSSLAFDTIYAEGQRRYVETLSPYARQFLDQMERPEVDSIDGLSPAISIEQKTTSRSPRSTVGTITEIYDYLRVLYAAIGVPHCPNCGIEISRQSTDQILEQVLALGAEERVMILAPIVRGRKGEYKKELDKLARQGFVRARIDGVLRQLDEEITLDRRKNHTIEVVVDRLLIKPEIEKRLEASIVTATKLAGGLVLVAVVNGPERLYSSKLACPDCGIERAAARTAVLFVQQPVRGLRNVQWPGESLDLRSGEGDRGSFAAPARRRARPRRRAQLRDPRAQRSGRAAEDPDPETVRRSYGQAADHAAGRRRASPGVLGILTSSIRKKSPAKPITIGSWATCRRTPARTAAASG